MSWLKKLFSPPPPTPVYKTSSELKQERLSAYFAKHRREIAAQIPAVFAAFDSQVKAELDALATLGLPLPKRQAQDHWWDVEHESYDWESPISGVNIALPQFTIPKFHYYFVRDFEKLGGITYLIPDGGTNRERQLYEDYNTCDGLTFFNRYKGRWFTRDPYQLFHACNEKKQGSYSANLSSLREIQRLPPLSEVFIFDQATIRRMDERIRVYNGLAHNFTPKLPRVLGKVDREINFVEPDITIYVPADILFNLDLPQPHFPKQVVTFTVLPQPATKLAATRTLLENIPPVSAPFAFELVDDGHTIAYQITCGQSDEQQIIHELQLALPGCSIIKRENRARRSLHSLTCTLTEYELRGASNSGSDLLSQVFNLLESAAPGETTVLQFLCWPFPSAIAKTYIEAMCRGYRYYDTLMFKDNGFTNKLKSKLPLWRTTIRILASKPCTLSKIKARYLDKFALPDNQWQVSAGTESISQRDMSTYVLLSTEELASFVHFPTSEMTCSRFETANMKSKLPPESYTTGETVIGQSEARGITTPVTIPDTVRDKHLYVVGKSGSGKSTLIFNIARQDIERGAGVAVIDPHGDLVEDLLNYIPEHRIKDAIYFDARDYEHPIALNVMDAENEEEVGLLADDLLVTFNRLSEAGAERMSAILRYVFHTLLRARDRSFLDIQKLLLDSMFRERIVRQLRSSELNRFWSETFPKYSKDATLPIINRMSKFVLSPALSGILSQSESLLSFYDVIQNNKILLVNLSKGKIGDDNAKLLGSLIVSQLQLAIMRRANIPKEERTPFYLFVDEFQNFTTSAFDTILSEARKYKLCLTLAHQYTSQLDEHLRNAILGNVGTLIMFEIFEKDAHYLRSQLGSYEPRDLTELSGAKHEALCKPQTGSRDTFRFITLTPPPVRTSFAEEIIEYTRENYSSTPEADTPPPEAEHLEEPQTETKEAQRRKRIIKQPAGAIPKQFASTGDQICYFVGQAEYLSTQQIIALCYGGVKDSAKAPAASRDLSKLVAAKQLRAQVFGKGKIYFTTGRTPHPTSHNLAVRDLYVKIINSGYEVTETKFFASQDELSPDLIVTFLAEDGSLIKTFWEYDTGTESVPVLQRKITHYEANHPDDPVTFVFASRQRQEQVAKSIQDGNVRFAILEEFQTLKESVFQYAGEESQTTFF